MGGKYLDRIFIADAATEKSSPVHVCCNDERVTLSWLITERQHQVAPKPLPTLIEDIDPLGGTDLKVLPVRVHVHKCANFAGRKIGESHFGRCGAVLTEAC